MNRSTRQAPSRSPRRSRRERYLAWLRGSVGLILLGSFLIVGGQHLLPRNLFLSAPEPVQAPQPTKGQAFDSLAKALAGLDAKTVRAYIDRYSKPDKGTVVVPGSPVFVDAEALAHSHPAWQLASAVEKGRIDITTARSFVSVGNFAASYSSAPNSSSTGRQALIGTLTHPGQTVTAPRIFRNVRAQERAALDDFLSDLSARQQVRAEDEASFARRSLEDEIAISTKKMATEIALQGVDPDLSLELTNLRLQLLRNLKVPLAQRQEAAERIKVIEARLNEIWREQTRRQQAALQAALEGVPAQLRREGEIRLAAELAQQRTAYDALQTQIRTEFEALAKGDFDQDKPRLALLRVFLAPAREPLFKPGSLKNFELSPRQVTSNSQLGIETRRVVTQSKTALNAGQIAVMLRQQARNDARVWARSAALRLGGKWSQNPNATNRTAEAQALLFRVTAGT